LKRILYRRERQMPEALGRHNFDQAWFAAGTLNTDYTKFTHSPVKEDAARVRVRPPFTEAVVDHHIAPEALEGALARMGFMKTKAMLMERLPTEPRTRTGNFGEVLAAEHLRQRHGYDMPVFKLRYMDNPQMPMRGEDLVAFRIGIKRVITALCVGESKAMQNFDSRAVKDAHLRLKTAYHPHPVSLMMISSILHDRKSKLAEQVDTIIETLGIRPIHRENWIFLITGNRPTDPFSEIQADAAVVENLTCVDVVLVNLSDFVTEIFNTPLRRPR
jgi:Cap4 SAVED domain